MKDDLRAEVALLKHDVGYLLDRVGAGHCVVPRPVNWTALTAETAAEQWAVLAGWVDWLIDRYSLTETIPGCWYVHPAVLEELSALQVAWLGAYCDSAAAAADGVLWHDMLERVLVRIREHDVTSCAAAAAHRADVEAATTAGSLSERAEAIRADIAARPQPQSPRTAPSAAQDAT
jgi:hypothetical protein